SGEMKDRGLAERVREVAELQSSPEAAVNQEVAGSSPARGATYFKHLVALPHRRFAMVPVFGSKMSTLSSAARKSSSLVVPRELGRHWSCGATLRSDGRAD